MIDTWDAARQAAAHATLAEIEAAALLKMRPMTGAHKLARFLAARSIPYGLVTRNVAASVAHFHATCWYGLRLTPSAERQFLLQTDCCYRCLIGVRHQC